MTTYVIADLHGRFDLLTDAISLIENDSPEGGTFIVLGDFVDRGPQSRNIIDLLMAGPSLPNWEWIVLQGNHEDIMLQALADSRKLNWWFGNGGVSTLMSYGYQDGDKIYPLKVPEDHLDWLINLLTEYEDDLRIYVHAGLPSHETLEDASKQTKQWMLYRDADDEYSDAQYHDDIPHLSGKHIVHGHHQSASHPLLKPHRTNLDSFAWNTGRLAIGVFNDTQAEPVKILEVIR